MVIYKGHAITLKHFLLSPVIAAGAGYDFNIGDVISFQVNSWIQLMGLIYNWFLDLPDCRVRELPKEIFYFFITVAFVFLYPVFFLPLATGVYLCLKKPKIVTDSDIFRLCSIVENKK